MADTEQQPLNALIVHDGDGHQDAVDVGQGIFMSRGVSNAYLVTTPGGNVVINTGTPAHGPETHRRFAEVSPETVRTIVFTQSHPDHIGGWRWFHGPETTIVAQASFSHVRRYWRGLEPFYHRRINRLWGRDLQPGNQPQPDDPVPDVTFFDSYFFNIGGRQFELYSVSGGETLDSLVVWLPDDRVVFTGNLTGPLFGHVPNIYTIRGDKIRSIDMFVASVQRVIDLRPETLITGHGEPIRGQDVVRNELVRIRDTAQYIWDRTWEGMNAGLDLWQLMKSVHLPPELDIPQGHGKVPWIVRAIWEEHVGWFRYESTTELYEVPPQAIWSEMVEMAGGPTDVAERALAHLQAGRLLHSLHLSDMALHVDGACTEALEARRGALQALLEVQGRENFSEVRWLESEIRTTNLALEENGSQ
jgi:glyoxylase-like metal-dependent hydrolase (beta-lactamase superfamily II)